MVFLGWKSRTLFADAGRDPKSGGHFPAARWRSDTCQGLWTEGVPGHKSGGDDKPGFSWGMQITPQKGLLSAKSISP